MDSQQVFTFGQQSLYMLLMVSAPLLLTVLAVGLVVSIFQAATQIHEATLSFVPKVLAAVAVLAIAGPVDADLAGRIPAAHAAGDSHGRRLAAACAAAACSPSPRPQVLGLGDADPLAVPARARAVQRAAGDRARRRAGAGAHRPRLPDRVLRAGDDARRSPPVALDSAAGMLAIAPAGADRRLARLRGRASSSPRSSSRARSIGLQMGLNFAAFFNPMTRRRGDRR